MSRICRLLLAPFLLGCFGGGMFAASPKYSVEVKGSEEGLPSVVIALTQTRDGYLWLGTMDQIVRFDGVQATEFNEANTPGFVSSPVVKLFEDSRGDFWIGTETAGIFVVQKGKLISLGLGKGSREARLSSICEDASGTIWLYTANGQLARYRDGAIREVVPVGAEYQSKCRALAVDEQGTIWVGTDVRLYGLRSDPGISNGVPQIAYEGIAKVDALLKSKHGGYWRLVNGRIEKWEGNRLARTPRPYAWLPWVTPVNAVCEDRAGNLIVGTGGEGAFWFKEDGSLVRFSTNNGLSHDTVLSLSVDREGDLWVGTDGGGLNFIKPQVFDVLEPTRGRVVKSVSPDAQGHLWIAYSGQQIDYWNGSTTRQYGETNALLNLNVRSVLVDSSQQVWAGTFGRGLLKLEHSLFLPAPQSEFFPWDKEISVLYEDRATNLWVGSQVGLYRWDRKSWKSFTTQEGLTANLIRAVVEDQAGNLWVGTQGGGLNRISGNQISHFTRANGLPSDNVWSLLADPDGVLWVGTSSGLARFANATWTSYSNRVENAWSTINYILDDSLGNLWLGASFGLFRVAKKELNDFAAGKADTVNGRSYGKPDGLPTRECSQGSEPAACRTADGNLWFSTINGLAFVNPKQLNQNTNPPPVLIQAVLVGGQVQTPASLRAPPPQSITVPPGKEGLQFEFTSLNLSAPEKGRFRYRLENHESGWTMAPGTTRWVRYSRVPPGPYRFQVTACNEDGVWNETGASVAVTILPPFWKTWWFVGGMTVLLLGFVVASVHYVSTQRLQRQLAALRQHEALEKERARIARDLHDQLGANLTQVALLGELAEADKALPGEVEAHAQQISQTARDTTRALDEIVWTVNPSNDTLDGLINYLCKYAQEYLAMAGLKYRLEVPPDLPSTPISPELRHNVFLAAKEAVNNIVKHAGADSAWVRLHLETDGFTLEIEDNGRGVAKADWDKGRSGLKNMRKRMEDVGGSFEVAPRPEGGTRVRLSAPLQRKSAAF